MGIPHVPEQVRWAPLLALRAVYGGIGRIVMVADRPAAAATQGARLVAPADVPADPGRAVDLPLPNYDTLSLASIRARLRPLDVAQLRVLLDYEAANAERAEVLGMFERRIEKLEAGT